MPPPGIVDEAFPMISLGACIDPASASLAKSAGFSYIELNVQTHLNPLAPDAEFLVQLARIKASPLPAMAANCFVPGNLKITGPDVDSDKLENYARIACSRASQAGLKIIVFGSGGARRIPEGFDHAKAWEQLLRFGSLAAGFAEKNNLIIAVEPLNQRECNVLTGTKESARYVREVAHPNFRLLVDSYHWALQNDSAEDIIASGDLISHIHVATPAHRRAPGAEPADFTVFFSALKKIQYSGGISVECEFGDLAAELPGAHRELALHI